MKEGRKRLVLLGLPVFENLRDLAALIHLDMARLSLLVEHSSRFYRTYQIPKRTGGWRTIRHPSREIKGIQAWILRNIIDKLIPSINATAYSRGKRLVDNVSPHSGNRYFLSIDLEDFFPSVSADSVKRVFLLVGYSRNAASIMSRLCTFQGYLPQGGVTSPALSNLIAIDLDRRLSGLTSRHNVVFTRYADDMTFSSNNPATLIKILPSIKRIVMSEGFTLNESKTRILGPRTQCRITGLVKNAVEPWFGIGRCKKNKMRAIMHNMLAKKASDPLYPNEKAIDGWLNFLKGVDARGYAQMYRYWNNLKQKYSH